MRSISLKSTVSQAMTEAFLQYWAYAYVLPDRLMFDKGKNEYTALLSTSAGQPGYYAFIYFHVTLTDIYIQMER